MKTVTTHMLSSPHLCTLPTSFGSCGKALVKHHSHWLLGCAGLNHLAHQIRLDEPVHRLVGAHDKVSSSAPISRPEQDDLGQIPPFLLHLFHTTRDWRHLGTCLARCGGPPRALFRLGFTGLCATDNVWRGWPCIRRRLFIFVKASRHSLYDDRYLAAREGPPAKRDAPFRDGALTFLLIKQGDKAGRQGKP